MKRCTFTWAPKGNSSAAALALAAAILLFPANMLPVLDTENAGRNRSDTILSGALELWHSGLWPIAIIVFTASIIIPVLKLVGLLWLILATRRGKPKNPKRLTRIYAALDFIGRWSMLDVFLAAFLTGLVEFGELATVRANGGIVAFGLAVVLTVFATQAFDPLSIWRGRPPDASPQPI
jgi:paraquat-inducible protein A